MTTSPPTSQLIAQYTTSFNAQSLQEHGVTSALGAWLLLALLAPSAKDEHLDAIENVLGTTASDAFARATALLEDPHPTLKSAVALWANNKFLNDTFESFTTSLPASVGHGSVPSQEQANNWTSSKTEGLIASFPASLSPDTAVVFASALATKASWAESFLDAEQELGGVFTTAPEVLRSPASHRVGLADTREIGRVGVHCAQTNDGLLVVSLIGEEDVAPSHLQSAALEVGTAVVNGERLDIPDLFDLPLESTSFYDVTEHLPGIRRAPLTNLRGVVARVGDSFPARHRKRTRHGRSLRHNERMVTRGESSRGI